MSVSNSFSIAVTRSAAPMKSVPIMNATIINVAIISLVSRPTRRPPVAPTIPDGGMDVYGALVGTKIKSIVTTRCLYSEAAICAARPFPESAGGPPRHRNPSCAGPTRRGNGPRFLGGKEREVFRCFHAARSLASWSKYTASGGAGPKRYSDTWRCRNRSTWPVPCVDAPVSRRPEGLYQG